MKAGDYTFQIFPDTDGLGIDFYVHFDHADPSDNEVWEDLGEFVDNNLPDFFSLDEADYETEVSEEKARGLLTAAGFKEVK